jgi:hypothetical protein
VATYYVRKTGNNSNLGTSAGQAWQTILKAFQSVASGDTVYIGAGTYREAGIALTASPTADTKFIGDVTGAQTGDAGEVIISAYVTNDTTAPVTASTFSLGSKNYVWLEKLTIVGGTAAAAAGGCVNVTGRNLTFRDVTFISSHVGGGGAPLVITGIVDTDNADVIDRCIFACAGANNGINITLPTSASADYDANISITNCLYNGAGTSFVNVATSGASSFKGGGVDMRECVNLAGGAILLRANSANLSTSIPCTCYYSWGGSLVANTSGQITEDYNYLIATTPRTNVTAGSNSKAASSSILPQAMLLEWGQQEVVGRQRKPFSTPLSGSPFLGFIPSGSSPAPSTTDLLNRPAPSGGASTGYALGCYERHDIATQETSVVDAGSNSIKLTGPGDHDLLIPVDASSTTITVRVRYDTTHGTGNKPQAQLLANGEIGFAGETVTAAAGVDTWETLTFAAFTPSAKGFVTLRLISRAAGGSGIAYFDTVTGGAQGSQGMDYFRRSEPFPAAVATGGSGGGPLVGGRLVN